jgi:hypothetical protein
MKSLPKKLNKVYTELIKVFNDNPKLTIKELLIVYGHLGYTLGASIAGYSGKAPGTKELTDKYMIEPTVDTALMLQGLQTILWAEDLGKTLEQVKQTIKDESDSV